MAKFMGAFPPALARLVFKPRIGRRVVEPCKSLADSVPSEEIVKRILGTGLHSVGSVPIDVFQKL